jgi:hypothetical protein
MSSVSYYVCCSCRRFMLNPVKLISEANEAVCKHSFCKNCIERTTDVAKRKGVIPGSDVMECDLRVAQQQSNDKENKCPECNLSFRKVTRDEAKGKVIVDFLSGHPQFFSNLIASGNSNALPVESEKDGIFFSDTDRNDLEEHFPSAVKRIRDLLRAFYQTKQIRNLRIAENLLFSLVPYKGVPSPMLIAWFREVNLAYIKFGMLRNAEELANKLGHFRDSFYEPIIDRYLASKNIANAIRLANITKLNFKYRLFRKISLFYIQNKCFIEAKRVIVLLPKYMVNELLVKMSKGLIEQGCLEDAKKVALNLYMRPFPTKGYFEDERVKIDLFYDIGMEYIKRKRLYRARTVVTHMPHDVSGRCYSCSQKEAFLSKRDLLLDALVVEHIKIVNLKLAETFSMEIFDSVKRNYCLGKIAVAYIKINDLAQARQVAEKLNGMSGEVLFHEIQSRIEKKKNNIELNELEKKYDCLSI